MGTSGGSPKFYPSPGASRLHPREIGATRTAQAGMWKVNMRVASMRA